jgi:hypothetical protein
MKAETFDKVEPKKDAYCKIVYLSRGRKIEREMYYGGRTESGIFFTENNWANDFLPLKIKQLLYVAECHR